MYWNGLVPGLKELNNPNQNNVAAGLGDKCCVTAYKLLKMLVKTDADINRDTLDRRLNRMKATGLK